MARDSAYVVPGDRLGSAAEMVAGPGTYCRGQHVYASVVGARVLHSAAEPDHPRIVTVPQAKRARAQDHVLEVGDVVMGKVLRIDNRMASIEILCVGDTVLREPYTGVIKKEDIRATEVDKAEIPKSFRPGDIVCARVISLGDSRKYFLSTASDELGVRWAKSAAGAAMVAIGREEMQCPVTKQLEPRKCANPS
ncbi:unnamed protein product [Phaeothamnion confervicola]